MRPDEAAAVMRAMPERLLDGMEVGVRDLTDALRYEADREVPVDRGKLRDSAGTRHPARFTGLVTYNRDYARHVYFGTGLYGPSGRKYPIRPFRRKALAFVSPDVAAFAKLAGGTTILGRAGARRKVRFIRGGKTVGTSLRAVVIVKSVMHPGIRPNRWLERAVNNLVPRADGIMRAALERAMA